MKMTKKEFKKQAMGAKIDARYSGKTKTMYLRGENCEAFYNQIRANYETEFAISYRP